MSDTVEMFRAIKDMRKAERERFGVPCPICTIKLPRAQPKVLLPRQVCRAHNPHYQDPRPHLTAEEFNRGMEGTGWTQGA
jgi:hypothetical protein